MLKKLLFPEQQQKYERNILLLGPPDAGKTQLLYSLTLKSAPTKPFESTHGFNYEKVTHWHENRRIMFTLNLFDVSGDVLVRPLWRHFYENMNIDVLCIVFDAHDKSAVLGFKDVFLALIHEKHLSESHILVVLNIKESHMQILTVDAITSILHLYDYPYLKVEFRRVNSKEGTGLQDLSTLLCA